MDDVAIALSWLALAAVLGIGEITLVGSFYLAPFAVGALIAAIVGLFGSFIASFVAFIIVSVLAFIALRPLAKKLEEVPEEAKGLGGNRLQDSTGVIDSMIPAGADQVGTVRVGTEQWRALSANELAVAKGTKVRVVEVIGTRLSVEEIQ